MTTVDAAPVEQGRLEFVHQLRGIAALVVVFGAHLLGVFWLNPTGVRALIGVPSWSPPPVPQFVLWLQHFPQIGFGHLGVALFFLISGLVIPFSIKRLGSFRFLIARAFRIYPTYWAGLAIGLAALYFSLQVWGAPWTSGFGHVLLQSLLVRDVFWLPSIDGISWTLEVEIKFYLLCAALAPIIIRGNFPSLLCVAFFGGGLFLWSGTWLDAVGRSYPALLWLLLALRMSWIMITYMLIGVMIHFHLVRAISTRVCIMGVAMLFALFAIEWHNSPLQAQTNGVYNYGAALVFFWIFYMRRRRPIRSRVLHFFGDISYPLYAVHPLAGYATLALALRAGCSPATSIALVVALIFGVAYALHRFVEVPSIALGHLLARRPKTSDVLEIPANRAQLDGAL